MTPDKILNYCLENLEGTVLVESWGEKGIFYNPDHVLKSTLSVKAICDYRQIEVRMHQVPGLQREGDEKERREEGGGGGGRGRGGR